MAAFKPHMVRARTPCGRSEATLSEGTIGADEPQQPHKTIIAITFESTEIGQITLNVRLRKAIHENASAL